MEILIAKKVFPNGSIFFTFDSSAQKFDQESGLKKFAKDVKEIVNRFREDSKKLVVIHIHFLSERILCCRKYRKKIFQFQQIPLTKEEQDKFWEHFVEVR
jgi:hypothetical protein